jgi:hypothetical protein
MMKTLILIAACVFAVVCSGCGSGDSAPPAANDPNSKANAGKPGVAGGAPAPGAQPGGATGAAAGVTP